MRIDSSSSTSTQPLASQAGGRTRTVTRTCCAAALLVTVDMADCRPESSRPGVGTVRSGDPRRSSSPSSAGHCQRSHTASSSGSTKDMPCDPMTFEISGARSATLPFKASRRIFLNELSARNLVWLALPECHESPFTGHAQIFTRHPCSTRRLVWPALEACTWGPQSRQMTLN